MGASRGELCETASPARVYVGVILDATESVRFVRAELGDEVAEGLLQAHAATR